MRDRLPYRSTIKSRSFFYVETKKFINLLLKGLNDVELVERIVNENHFQVNSDTRRKEIARTIQIRLQALDDFLQEEIITNNLDTSKSIVLYSIMKTDQLFYEFMHEVIYENVVINGSEIKDLHFDSYFEHKKQQSKVVASWHDYTIYKLKRVYRRILLDAGFIQQDEQRYFVTLPIIDPAIAAHIQDKEHARFIHYLFGRN